MQAPPSPITGFIYFIGLQWQQVNHSFGCFTVKLYFLFYFLTGNTALNENTEVRCTGLFTEGDKTVVLAVSD